MGMLLSARRRLSLDRNANEDELDTLVYLNINAFSKINRERVLITASLICILCKGNFWYGFILEGERVQFTAIDK
jgi:hypothetical protein